MSATDQHFQLVTTLEKAPARSARASRPSWVLAVSWLCAAASAATIGGIAGAITGGFALFAIPSAWLVLEMRDARVETST